MRFSDLVNFQREWKKLAVDIASGATKVRVEKERPRPISKNNWRMLADRMISNIITTLVLYLPVKCASSSRMAVSYRIHGVRFGGRF